MAAAMELPHKYTLEVQYPTEQSASVVYNALIVDGELQPDKIHRTMRVEGQKLIVNFECSELRLLRIAFSSFMDFLQLANRTVEEFGA
eukprot:tig00020849_g14631.t1